MKYWILILVAAMSLLSCGPRRTLKVHFVSLKEANDGRALPLHVVPVDIGLKARVDAMTAEEWFVSDEPDTLTGIQKRVLQKAQQEVVQLERVNNKNDFVVIVDFSNSENPDQQKLLIGDKYYRAKDVFVVVDRDRVRIVPKSVYQDYMRAN